MALDDDFASAKTRVEKLSRTPGSDELLELYSLYKQSTQGDATGSRPGMLDFKGRAKFDAWASRRGMTKDAAKQAYVDAVARLEKKYG
jgi:diazepam-binding inhibitor (GABA receptor modulator, acyl-CoA-binding protein)